MRCARGENPKKEETAVSSPVTHHHDENENSRGDSCDPKRMLCRPMQEFPEPAGTTRVRRTPKILQLEVAQRNETTQKKERGVLQHMSAQGHSIRREIASAIDRHHDGRVRCEKNDVG